MIKKLRHTFYLYQIQKTFTTKRFIFLFFLPQLMEESNVWEKVCFFLSNTKYNIKGSYKYNIKYKYNIRCSSNLIVPSWNDQSPET